MNDLPPEWQTVNDYVRAFVAERLRAALHNQDGVYRRLEEHEAEVALQAVFDLLAEQPFIDAVKALP